MRPENDRTDSEAPSRGVRWLRTANLLVRFMINVVKFVIMLVSLQAR